MCGLLYFIEIFSSISNSLEQIHFSNDITVWATRFGSYEDSDKKGPYNHEYEDGYYLCTDDSQYIHQRMETGSQEESDNAPEYE